MLSKCPGVLSQPYLNLGSTIFECIPGVFPGVFPSVFLMRFLVFSDVFPDALPGVIPDVFPTLFGELNGVLATSCTSANSEHLADVPDILPGQFSFKAWLLFLLGVVWCRQHSVAA